MKVARAHARVLDTRRDWQHKLSTAIIRENQAVYVEDLCVVGLGRTRLAKSVHDAGWAGFTAMLQYKAARYGRTFARVDRFFPSTRMCSQCGRINEKMALNVRAWLPLRQPPRPGRQRREEHQGRRTGGPQRPWSAGKTGTRPGTARRNGNPPARRVFHAQREGNLRPLALGRRGCQLSPGGRTPTHPLAVLGHEVRSGVRGGGFPRPRRLVVRRSRCGVLRVRAVRL